MKKKDALTLHKPSGMTQETQVRGCHLCHIMEFRCGNTFQQALPLEGRTFMAATECRRESCRDPGARLLYLGRCHSAACISRRCHRDYSPPRCCRSKSLWPLHLRTWLTRRDTHDAFRSRL